MFADISGYTALCERIAMRGPNGVDLLAKYLNQYFEQFIRGISAAGGDVFKFAGDAAIILWPPYRDETVAMFVQRAVQCAIFAQEDLDEDMKGYKLAEGVYLRVKIGIGAGEAEVLHIGGVEDMDGIGRMECITSGPCVIQSFNAEHHATPGDIICSKEAWKHIQDKFEVEEIPEDASGSFYKILKRSENSRGLPKRNVTVVSNLIPSLNHNYGEKLCLTHHLLLQCLVRKEGGNDRMVER